MVSLVETQLNGTRAFIAVTFQMIWITGLEWKETGSLFMVWLLNIVKDTWPWFMEIAVGRCRRGCDLPLHMPYTYAYFGLSSMCQ